MSYISEQVKTNEILFAAIKKWGKQSQMEMAIEECAELIKAIQKLKRAGDENPREFEFIRAVCDEIADVEIIMQQLKLIFPVQLIEEIKIAKIERLEKRIQSSTN